MVRAVAGVATIETDPITLVVTLAARCVFFGEGDSAMNVQVPQIEVRHAVPRVILGNADITATVPYAVMDHSPLEAEMFPGSEHVVRPLNGDGKTHGSLSLFRFLVFKNGDRIPNEHFGFVGVATEIASPVVSLHIVDSFPETAPPDSVRKAGDKFIDFF